MFQTSVILHKLEYAAEKRIPLPLYYNKNKLIFPTHSVKLLSPWLLNSQDSCYNRNGKINLKRNK